MLFNNNINIVICLTFVRSIVILKYNIILSTLQRDVRCPIRFPVHDTVHLSEGEKMQYMRIFSKKEDEYVRYWASISTAKVDDKNKKTAEYMRANISVRLSESAETVFKDSSEKTKTKGIRQLNVEVTDFWL